MYTKIILPATILVLASCGNRSKNEKLETVITIENPNALLNQFTNAHFNPLDASTQMFTVSAKKNGDSKNEIGI